MAGYGGQSPLQQAFWYVYILKCSNGTYKPGSIEYGLILKVKRICSLEYCLMD